MKTVFSNASDCIHTFAQQTQEYGRSNNVFFDGKILYSYGYHYELAKFLTKDIVLINDVGYSNTTAKHIQKASQALRQYQILEATYYDIILVNKELKRLESKLLKANKPHIYIDSALNLISEHLRQQRIFPSNLKDADEIAKFREYQELFNTNLEQFAEKIAENKAKIKAKKALAFQKFEHAFRTFEPYNVYKFDANSEFDLLRISECGTKLETSQNVNVNLDKAKTLYKALCKGIDVVGQKIDWYLIRSIKDGVIKIGCHNIKITELENVFNKG